MDRDYKTTIQGSSLKRSRSRSPPPWRKVKEPRREDSFRRVPNNRPKEGFAKEQSRINQIQEEEQMRQWVSKEDEFVLKQSKKKAQIRVREGRAKPIDWLAVTLSVIDPTADLLDDEMSPSELDIVDPDGIISELDVGRLQELEKDITNYAVLETSSQNLAFWKAMRVICQDRQSRLAPSTGRYRTTNTVSGDIDRLLIPKSFLQLKTLEKQVRAKLDSDEPIDVEYWDQLLHSIGVYKAKAELQEIYRSVLDSRLETLRYQQKAEAQDIGEKLSILFNDANGVELGSPALVVWSRTLDPEPSLQVKTKDKGVEIMEEGDLWDKVASERHRIVKMKYVPMRQRPQEKQSSYHNNVITTGEAQPTSGARFAPAANEDFSQATKALYEREVARGVQEDEEIFAGEEEVSTASKHLWAGKYRPRKPRHFNRVQMGYEWNKYNQTHYDHDNPPPKVVQGYKFNIFYPDLIDKTRAPTYRIERENGRKRGQSFAPAGEEDTCLIRFISGPPYEDIAFRIVDKEWDYSAKRERGFRSSFDKVQNIKSTLLLGNLSEIIYE
ncbi:hypothetical protein MMC25_003102 [Agyrium rufum]|nr:hypothetical protein [Agyrium rufum]